MSSETLYLRRVDAGALSLREREHLIERVVDVTADVLDVPRQTLVDYYTDPRADGLTFSLAEDAQGRLLGSLSFKYYRHVIGGKVYDVVRTGAILGPRARGKNVVHRSWLREYGHAVAAGRARNLHIFIMLIHPRSYRLLTGVGPVVFPHPEHGMPVHLERLMGQLFERTGLQVLAPGRPYTVHDELRVADRHSDDATWRTSDDPAVRYFIEQCPSYGDGAALAVLIPAGPVFIARIVAKLVGKRVGRILRAQAGLITGRAT